MIKGMVKGMATTLSTMFRRPVTIQYPEQRRPVEERFRGAPALLWDAEVSEPYCTGCGICQRECPVGAISVTMKDNEKAKEGKSTRKKIVDVYQLNLGRCTFCEICVEVCNFNAIKMSHQFELAGYSRKSLYRNLDQLIEMGSGRREG
ncbi:MAG: NADH-quinone oxidoreductase subunit I [Dehalococcoidia bacterium]|nr:NADH-quinone oxidoreductase subunit I [Dehalococcoidia bacterium]